MNILWTIFFFILALAVLVVVHELGHFLVARACGVRVMRFSVGFGRIVWSRHFGADRTEWALCAIPLGGYVKMLDEREGEVPEAQVSRAFNRQSVWKRIAIVAAGPAANFLLALLLYWVVFMAGVDELQPVLDAPPAASSAAVVGLSRGDRVVQVGEDPVLTWQALRLQILEAALNGPTAALKVAAPDGGERVVVLDLSAVDREHLDKDYLSALGVVPERPRIPAVVGSVSPDGAAAAAGIVVGDYITAMDDQPISHWAEVVSFVRANPGRDITVRYTRSNEPRDVVVRVAQATEGGQTIGRIGLGPKLEARPNAHLVRVNYGPVDAIAYSLSTTWDTTRLSLSMMWKMVWGEVSWRNLSGPVAIADYAGRTAAMGPSVYVRFIALVSISLGIVNLLPIPVLDGGHLMYYFAELLKGSPVSEKTMALGQKIGFALLFMLMAFALFNDLTRLLGSLSG